MGTDGRYYANVSTNMSHFPGSAVRSTPPVVDVLAVLLAAHRKGAVLDARNIAVSAHRFAGSVFLALDELGSRGWVSERWEDEAGDYPRRRVYALTDFGVLHAPELVAQGRQRRPQPWRRRARIAVSELVSRSRRS